MGGKARGDASEEREIGTLDDLNRAQECSNDSTSSWIVGTMTGSAFERGRTVTER